jgi:hypothetical protein
VSVNTLFLIKLVCMKRNLKSKKVKALISEYINFSKNQKPTNFFSLWKRVSGEKIANETDSVRYNNNTLFIKLKNPNIKLVVIKEERDILKKISLLNSNVTRLIFD